MVVLIKRCVEQQSCIKLNKNDAAITTSFDSQGGCGSELLDSDFAKLSKSHTSDVLNRFGH